jgi:transcriptional regulator with XRE-family HTH domain
VLLPLEFRDSDRYCVTVTQSQSWAAFPPTDMYEIVTEGDWGQRVTQTIAREIRRWRERRGLSAQELSERCDRLGNPIPRNVIANLENDRRHTISVAEMLTFAMALNVPPVLLMYPLGVDSGVEIAPGRGVAPWSAIRWFTGENRPHAALLGNEPEPDTRHGMREWEEAYQVIEMHRRHDALVQQYRFTRDDTLTELRRLAEPSHEQRAALARADVVAEQLVKAGEALRRHRRRMNGLGYELPRLPADIDLTEDPLT